MFRVRMLSADYGDCLWVEYGSARNPYRLLIDSGTLAAYPGLRATIEKDLDSAHRHFQLFVVTHVDLDHIDAAVRLLNSPSLKLRFDEVWFNGWHQLLDKDVLGPRQGEFLSALVAKRRIPLNHAFNSGSRLRAHRWAFEASQNAGRNEAHSVGARTRRTPALKSRVEENHGEGCRKRQAGFAGG